MVSMLAFYSDDPSLNPAVFSVKFVFEKNDNKKEAEVGPFLEVRYYIGVEYTLQCQ